VGRGPYLQRSVHGLGLLLKMTGDAVHALLPQLRSQDRLNLGIHLMGRVARKTLELPVLLRVPPEALARPGVEVSALLPLLVDLRVAIGTPFGGWSLEEVLLEENGIKPLTPSKEREEEKKEYHFLKASWTRAGTRWTL